MVGEGGGGGTHILALPGRSVGEGGCAVWQVRGEGRAYMQCGR